MREVEGRQKPEISNDSTRDRGVGDADNPIPINGVPLSVCFSRIFLFKDPCNTEMKFLPVIVNFESIWLDRI